MEMNLKRIFSLVPLIYHQQGIELSLLQKMAGFSKEKEVRQALDRLMMFGMPPFSPSDFISIHIDENQYVYLDFPLGLERPLALSGAEWTLIQKIIREELEFITKESAASERLKEILSRFSDVSVSFENDEQVVLQRNIIQEALQESLQIEFLYRSLSSKEAEIRRVSPWLLFENKGMSYLVAYCSTRAAPRCFLLERMQNIELLDIKQENLPSQDLSIYLQNSPFFQKKPKGFTVKLAFAPDLLANLRLLFSLENVRPWTGKQKKAIGKPSCSSWLQAVCKIQDSIWLRSILRGLGAEIILLEPAHLRETCKNELEEITLPQGF